MREKFIKIRQKFSAFQAIKNVHSRGRSSDPMKRGKNNHFLHTILFFIELINYLLNHTMTVIGDLLPQLFSVLPIHYTRIQVMLGSRQQQLVNFAFQLISVFIFPSLSRNVFLVPPRRFFFTDYIISFSLFSRSTCTALTLFSLSIYAVSLSSRDLPVMNCYYRRHLAANLAVEIRRRLGFDLNANIPNCCATWRANGSRLKVKIEIIVF